MSGCVLTPPYGSGRAEAVPDLTVGPSIPPKFYTQEPLGESPQTWGTHLSAEFAPSVSSGSPLYPHTYQGKGCLCSAPPLPLGLKTRSSNSPL